MKKHLSPTTVAYTELSSSDVESLNIDDSVQKKSLQAKVFQALRYSIIAFITSLVMAILITGLFFPSYATPPPLTYQQEEKTFIAANIVDKDLINGAWGESILALVDLLGPDNTFLSIYGGPSDALDQFRMRVPCNHTIMSEEEFPIDTMKLKSVDTPSGPRTPRISFLADVRNHALAPLDVIETRFDRLLFLNDIYFHPEDAVRLLYSTNMVDGKAQYTTACSLDFINAFKFYDTFATRDQEGYKMGLPFYPWFTNEGEGLSRKDVLRGTDAVRVKSCWGGMVAFDAQWFQKKDVDIDPPVRFRSDQNASHYSSECCLVNADLELTAGDKNMGIFVNPYIRVAYDSRSLAWIGFSKRFEKLYAIPHRILNYLIHLPRPNKRISETQQQVVEHNVWSLTSLHQGSSGGISGEYVARGQNVSAGGFCGVERTVVMKHDRKKGEKPYEALSADGTPVH